MQGNTAAPDFSKAASPSVSMILRVNPSDTQAAASNPTRPDPASGGCQHACPSVERLQWPAVAEDRVCRAREERVGQHGFLEQAESHQRQAPAKLAGREGAGTNELR